MSATSGRPTGRAARWENGLPNEWEPANPSGNGGRDQKWKPKYPVPSPLGGQPGASWDPINGHWDVDWGLGGPRDRFLPDGTPVDHWNNPIDRQTMPGRISVGSRRDWGVPCHSDRWTVHIPDHEPRPGDAMRLLSETEALTWCEERGLPGRETPQQAPHVWFPDAPAAVHARIDSEARRRLLLAEFLASLVRHEPEVLVWTTSWGIGAEYVEGVGNTITTCVLGAESGEHGWAAVVDVDAQLPAAIALPLLFEWDAVVIPPLGSHLVRISHDGYLSVHGGDEPFQAEIRSRLDEAGILIRHPGGG